MMHQDDDALRRLAADARYQRLVSRRGRFAVLLTAIMLSAYIGYVLLVAFDKPLLARPIAGGATTVGIPLGLGVIGLSIMLTGIYVWRANREFDAELAAIVMGSRG